MKKQVFIFTHLEMNRKNGLQTKEAILFVKKNG